jgi:hypothetical protein
MTLSSYGSSDLVNEATRVQGNSSTCIDHCYTNRAESVSVQSNKNSVFDHFGLDIEHHIRHVKCTNVPITRRKYLSQAIASKLNQNLSGQDW